MSRRISGSSRVLGMAARLLSTPNQHDDCRSIPPISLEEYNYKYGPRHEKRLDVRRFSFIATNGLENYVVNLYGRRPTRLGGRVACWSHCGGRSCCTSGTMARECKFPFFRCRRTLGTWRGSRCSFTCLNLSRRLPGWGMLMCHFDRHLEQFWYVGNHIHS